MMDWDLTEITIYCDAVGTYVRLMVYGDGCMMCSGYKKYFDSPVKSASEELKKREKKLGKNVRCKGLECSKLVGYKKKLFSEMEAS